MNAFLNSPQNVNAETYTEKRLYQLCAVSNEKIKIFYEWQNNKERYRGETNTIISEFQNYSLHDHTHAKAIVSSIEKFLGEERINLLGIGDLWLILNAAYSHDIGMRIKYEEVLRLWKDDKEFHEYILQLANHPEMKLQKEARYYLQIHNLLNKKSQMDGMEGKNGRILNLTRDWPVILKRNVILLTNEHFRKRHAKRSQEYMTNYKNVLGIHVAENRLYKVLGDIACAHGEDFKYVLENLWIEEDGFGEEKVHPQFVASLLRLGDLLDMDNNRFDPYSLEHFGELPASSTTHLKRHLSLTHLTINARQIKAVEEAEDYDTCKLALDWFKMIEEETKQLRANWNVFAPEKLEGCLFQGCDLKVYLNGNLYQRRQQNKFQVEQKKFMDIMIGDKLYDNQLVFVREYIQNSMDAVKVLLGEQVNAGKSIVKLYQEEQINPLERAPLEMKADYLQDLALEIRLDMISAQDDDDADRVRITFKDAGIGIDEECFQVLSVIGTSWKGRKQYSDELSRMSCWFYPSGGFGVGIQSGFMHSDQIHVITSPLKDTKGYEIILTSPKAGGNIDIVDKLPGKTGTETWLEIDKDKILQIIFPQLNERIQSELLKDQSKYTNKTECLKLVKDALKEYIKRVFPNCLFPIELKYQGDTQLVSEPIHGALYRVLKEKDLSFEYDAETECAWAYLPDKEMRFVVWNYKEKYYGEITLNSSGINDNICYRGIHVDAEQLISPEISILLDLYQSKAEDWLLISRSGFEPGKKYYVYDLAKNLFLLYLKTMTARYIDATSNCEKDDKIFDDAVLRAFLTGAFYFPKWDFASELLKGKRPIQAIQFIKDGEKDEIIRKAANILFGDLFRCVYEGKYIFWQYSGQEQCERQIVLTNVINGTSALKLNQMLSDMLHGQGSEMRIITDPRYVALFEAINHFPKDRVQLVLPDGNLMTLGYMNCAREDIKTSNRLEEVLREEVLREEADEKALPSYLEVSYQEEFSVLYIGMLPFEKCEDSICRDKNIIFLPYRIPELKIADSDAILTWDQYWKNVTDSKSWKDVVNWVLRHPKNEYSFIERSAVEDAYKKIYAIIYKLLKKR